MLKGEDLMDFKKTGKFKKRSAKTSAPSSKSTPKSSGAPSTSVDAKKKKELNFYLQFHFQ